MIVYNKLFQLLHQRGLDYSEVSLSESEYSSLAAGKDMSMEVIDRLCAALDVQPDDIMEVLLDVRQ